MGAEKRLDRTPHGVDTGMSHQRVCCLEGDASAEKASTSRRWRGMNVFHERDRNERRRVASSISPSRVLRVGSKSGTATHSSSLSVFACLSPCSLRYPAVPERFSC